MNSNSKTQSVRASVRELSKLALASSESASPQQITRTVKLKVRTDGNPTLHQALSNHFAAVEGFRRRVLRELEEWWLKDPRAFEQMVTCNGKERFEEKSSCYGWMYTKFLKGAKLDGGLTRDAANSVLWSLQGGLKGFLTRRENVTTDIRKTYEDNAKLWDEKIAETIREFHLDNPRPPTAPPTIDFENLTESKIEVYNRWVGQARVWGNLILHQQLVQQGKLDREDAKLPRRLKGYPGFPGSERYKEQAAVSDALARLKSASGALIQAAPQRFANVTPEQWLTVLDRFSGPQKSDMETPRPRTVKQMAAQRLHYLASQHPEWTPAQVSTELLAGMERMAAKLENHLARTNYSDRRALIKLANVFNVAGIFALEPFRAAGDYVGYFEADESRRDAFGALRGAFTQPSDDTAAIEITGFSLSGDSPQYCGLLACRPTANGRQEWAFLYAIGNEDMKLFASAPVKPPRNWQQSNWLGFATEGKDEEKRVLRGSVWFPAADGKVKPATVLPLDFGARQGREYLWHFDRDLRTREEWTPLNARLLRIMPPNQPQAGEFYVTLTFSRLAPPVVKIQAERFVGVDRGEAVPAAFALVDSAGKFLAKPDRLKAFHEYLRRLDAWEQSNAPLAEAERDWASYPEWSSHPDDGFGFIAAEYREQQRTFNNMKRELQRNRGGYTRWLRAKERNRAKALGGQVARELLNLASTKRAPLVFESLDSGIATRGGRGTMMSQMQYTRVFTAVEQRLAEAGLCEIPRQPRFRKWDNGFIKLVVPANTSSTCSACGHVHSTDFYESLIERIEHGGDGHWHVALADLTKRTFPKAYSYWIRGKGMKTANTNERLLTLLNGKSVTALSKSSRRALTSLLKSRLLPFRPDQAQFKCVMCSHEMNADLQAALNIARRHLFNLEYPPKKAQTDRRELWGSWYRKKLATVWK